MRRVLSRLAALGLLLAVCCAAIFGVAMPLADAYFAGAERVKDLTEQITAFRARRGQALGGQPVEITDPALVIADSEALAGVQLQQMVDRVLDQSNATMESRSTDKPVPEENWTRINLRMDLRVPEENLPSLLHRLETGSTYLFIEEILLRRQSARGDPDVPLTVRLRVSGLMQRPTP